ncbi:MAG: hypothetical protein A2Z82_08785 [Nitrospirae bacterium GWA2_46_11]|nr:MAG: hypothetical protein A2Z82_08785 [Nitrospirae bacterium GWA2_46_11]
MLNELRDLARSLLTSGVEFTDWHPNFNECPKSGMTCFIYLNEHGDIEDISFPEPDFDVTTVRKWGKANGCSFPAFNVPSLFKAQNDETVSEVNQFKKDLKKGNPIATEALNKVMENCASNWDSTALSSINRCLTRATSEIEEQLGTIPAEYSSIKKLLQRAKQLNAEVFYQQLKNQLLQKGNVNINTNILDILFQTSNTGKKFQVVFEIRDWTAIGSSYPANNLNVQRWMNDRMIYFSSENRTSGSVDKDAFNGSSDGWEEKLPAVRMPILGNVILRAMSSESLCQKRYEMMDAFSFPIGASLRQEMKGSLEWLSDVTRKRKTWIDLTRKVENATILFAYPTQKPETEPELAGLMGGFEEAVSDPDGTTFSAIASRVTRTLRGISTGASDNEVRIFVLTKRPGDARTKVIVSKRYTTEHAIKSAEQWQSGCRNIPNIKIRQFENKTPRWKECLIPFPAEVVWCLNTAWIRQGTYAERVHGFSINDALSLLLDEGNEVKRLSLRAIDAIVRNCASLLLAIGQENTYFLVLKMSKKYEKQALLLPSILGLLLYKNGIEKGGFMNSSAYLVGRLLSLVDDLHLKYCQHARKGSSIPPQLVGNALMPTALEAPERALSMLSQRIPPYQAWAKTLSDTEQDVGLVKYFLKQIGEVSNQLKEAGLSPTCSDTDKAQMLLGYLARTENN